MTKESRDLQVIQVRQIVAEFYEIKLFTGEPFPDFLPGQFLQFMVEDNRETFLRRPLSVHDYDSLTGELKLLIHAIGKGTRSIVSLKPGEMVNAIFPLGNSFTLPKAGEKVLLTGGGCGVAPLLFLGRKISEAGIDPQFLLGFRGKDTMLETDNYKELGKVHLTTEDGSEGVRGFVTAHDILKSEKFDRIYCCGPEPMMRAVAGVAKDNGIECEVSLENLMACGFGVCLCCVVDTTDGRLCSCTDGPVFNIRKLKW